MLRVLTIPLKCIAAVILIFQLSTYHINSLIVIFVSWLCFHDFLLFSRVSKLGHSCWLVLNSIFSQLYFYLWTHSYYEIGFEKCLFVSKRSSSLITKNLNNKIQFFLPIRLVSFECLFSIREIVNFICAKAYLISHFLLCSFIFQWLPRWLYENFNSKISLQRSWL